MRGMAKWAALAAVLALVVRPPSAQAQTFPTDDPDPVLEAIWERATEESRYHELAQVLMDSIGPRLTGSPGMDAAHQWAVETYESWGIEAENDAYGEWTAWERGVTHIDLVEPRVRSLDGTVRAWSGGTDGPLEGPVLTLPEVEGEADFEAWLPEAEGAYILLHEGLITCRPAEDYREFGREGALERLQEEQTAVSAAFNQSRLQPTGLNRGEIVERLEEAGAAGVIQSSWRGDGILGILRAPSREMVGMDLTCEDYGLLYRLAENEQGPVLRVNAEMEFLGTTPTYNTIATIPGTERPDEYVMLSAHFDTWDGASGATDNGTGTILMMEVMRILNEVYPQPKRTIIAGHWGGEEQGLNGSRAWAYDNQDVVDNLQALFNQDNGTGRIRRISMQGFTEAERFFEDWMGRMPEEVTGHVELAAPGNPSGGGTDHASFVCYEAPAFMLSSLSWNYRPLTHHTNRDTFDKIVLEEKINNLAFTAMLTYLASEDPEMIPRDTREGSWPGCRDGRRTAPE